MQCAQCGLQFDHLQSEAEIYKKFDAKLPENCPQCRRKRHLIFRNEKNLFYNKSFLSGKKIISLYPESSPFRIIDQGEWWSDDFDATIYGISLPAGRQGFDFNRPFFDQYKDLQKIVPRWARIVVNCENSDFNNNCADIKNSYLTFSSYESEELYYCMRVIRSKDCIDCMNVSDSQFCSQCADCKRCYSLHYSLLSENCSESYYLFDCKNCKDCILSSSLRNKQYIILNQQYSKEDYERKKQEFLLELNRDKNGIDEKFKKLISETPHRNVNIINTQNCEGNFINDSKNIINGFYILDSEDCFNVYDSSYLKNCYENSYNEKSELCLEIDTSYNLYDSKFCTYTIALQECMYCDQCDHLKNCFGCIGVKRNSHMILNKKYSKEDYEEMMRKVKKHMISTGEWGMAFPSTLTPFAYNTVLAYEYYPLSKEEALKQGYMWNDEADIKHIEETEEAAKFSGSIDEVDENICSKALICEESKKKYKIIPQEFKFYKKFHLPIPKISPDQRYKKLRTFQPQKKLVEAICSVCGKNIKTVYPKESGYKILCEDCYYKKVS